MPSRTPEADDPETRYRATSARATDRLELLARLRGVHPLFGMYLMQHMALADQSERIQALESLLEIPGSLGRAIEVPSLEELPQGPLATERLNPLLLTRGLATQAELFAPGEDEDEDPRRGWYDDAPPRILTLAHKLQRLFQSEFPGVADLKIRPCWVAGELLVFGGDFNHYITSHSLQKQEGAIFRHLLRMILLIDEMAMICPDGMEHDEWKEFMGTLAFSIEQSCRAADPDSTDQWLDETRGQAVD